MAENNAVLASNESSQSNSTVDISEFGYQQELKRTMNVWQLTAFGLNYMVPIAPAIIFGFLLRLRAERLQCLIC
jgi:putrescine importer